MKITLIIPDELAAGIAGETGDLSRIALESLAIEGYRSTRLSALQVRQLLGHESRWVTEDFLASHGVWPGLTMEDAQNDAGSLSRLLQSPIR